MKQFILQYDTTDGEYCMIYYDTETKLQYWSNRWTSNINELLNIPIDDYVKNTDVLYDSVEEIINEEIIYNTYITTRFPDGFEPAPDLLDTHPELFL